jgi:hypothetical protein
MLAGFFGLCVPLVACTRFRSLLHERAVPAARVPAFSIIETLDVVEHVSFGFLPAT